eukprot:TRINITY_DN10910_c0_g3_i1.p1 TRINITY_DN10910_c0_g3~~TRINITY_DN10910_c0_g3_i1.p1  ORF type:complete len:309 (-),score=64.09 TRINITY_DN10910_c0_g3_i1:84-1010(-)
MSGRRRGGRQRAMHHMVPWNGEPIETGPPSMSDIFVYPSEPLALRFAGQDQVPSDNLYIDGLPSVIDQNLLAMLFFQVGANVVRSKVLRDVKESGACRAMVQVASLAEAQQAIRDLSGVIIEIKQTDGKFLLSMEAPGDGDSPNGDGDGFITIGAVSQQSGDLSFQLGGDGAHHASLGSRAHVEGWMAAQNYWYGQRGGCWQGQGHDENQGWEAQPQQQQPQPQHQQQQQQQQQPQQQQQQPQQHQNEYVMAAMLCGCGQLDCESAYCQGRRGWWSKPAASLQGTSPASGGEAGCMEGSVLKEAYTVQ